MALIELTNLSKIYGFGTATTVALDNVSLEINEGEFVAIMGPSCCGKSTLMHIIGLLDRPTHGEILMEGKSLEEVPDEQRAMLRRQKIGFVFQSFNLLPRLRAIENVALPLTYSGFSYIKQLKRAEEMLKKVDLSDRLYYMPGQLSGGQIQRVAIARALINKPVLVLADEPTGNLDSASGREVMELLTDLHKQGNTVLVVTHDPNVAAYAHRLVHMIDGRVDSDTKTATGKKAKRPKQTKAPKRVKATKGNKAPTERKSIKKTKKKSARKVKK